MTVDDRGREIDEPAIGHPRLLAQHRKRARPVDLVALHQDPLGAFDERAATKRALEVVILGEASQDDVDRALPVLDIRIADMREHAALGRLPDEPRITRMQQHDHRTRRLAHDRVDHLQRMLRTLPQTNQRDIGPLTRRHRPDIPHLDLARDHLMTQPDHHRRHQRQTILTLIGDQNPQMPHLTVIHKPLQARSSLVAGVRCAMGARFASTHGERCGSPVDRLTRRRGPARRGLDHARRRRATAAVEHGYLWYESADSHLNPR